MYGEGMVLIKPDAPYVADAGSQSGTWLDEKKAREEHERRRNDASQQPHLRSHKSQRMMNDGIDHASRQELPIGNSAGVPSSNSAAMATASAGQLVIDDFTMHLGIGWRRISDAEHIQAAARGWARFIENHFALCNVRICLESKGLQSYLVEASEGYFLFAEDLRRGRLVSRTVECALRNLQLSPPIFDGPELEMKPLSRATSNHSTDMEMRVD